MATEEKTGWECRFCFERLKRSPSLGWQRLLWFVPVRPYRCPHCFNTFQKPVGFLANIPFVKHVFCEKRGLYAGLRGLIVKLAGRKTDSRRNYVNPNWFVRFARWTGEIETRASDAFKGTVRKIWLTFLWPLHWLSRKTGNSHRSLQSCRTKSRKRHGSRHHDEHEIHESCDAQASSGINKATGLDSEARPDHQ
jgi:hypothetical protein